MDAGSFARRRYALPTGARHSRGRRDEPGRCFCQPAHPESREFFHEAFQEDCGTHLYPGPLYKMSETPLGIRRGPVMFGQDNEYVYRELLGYSEEEYADFVAAGHIGTDYAPGVG